MALIELQPGETFSHSHDAVSTTAAVSGDIDLTMNGQTIRLTALPVAIAPFTLHVMRNVGDTVATFACGYGFSGGGA